MATFRTAEPLVKRLAAEAGDGSLRASADEALPDRVAGLVHAVLDEAARNLDAAVATQCRGRALRRLEVLHAHGAGGEPVRDIPELPPVA